MVKLNLKSFKKKLLEILLAVLAVLFVVFITVILTKKTQEFAPPPKLGLFISYGEGNILINEGDGQWIPATNQSVLSTGNRIRTGENSRAVLITPRGNIVRMSANTEISVAQISETDTFLTQSSGKAYYISKTPSGQQYSYKVKALNHIINATGTAFDLSTNLKANRVNAKILEGKIDIVISLEDIIEVQKIGKRKEITVDPGGDNIIILGDISAEYIDSEWYKWNTGENEKFSAGFGFIQKDTEKEADDSDTDLSSVKKPAITESASQTAATSKSSCAPYLTAKKDTAYNGILVSWTTCASDDFQFYKVIRSTLNPTPSYPNDPVVSSSSNKSYANFIDKTIAPNRTYYYRVCVIERVNNVTCGNVVSVDY